MEPRSGLDPYILHRLKDIQFKYSSLYRPGRYFKVNKIAGLDCSYDNDFIKCAGVIVNRGGEILEKEIIGGICRFPYISGFFAFREGPWLVALLRKFTSLPDIVFVDGNGLLHPRRAGLAVFVGVKTGLATIGVSKRPLKGLPWRCAERIVALQDGYAFCRSGWKRPIFVSPGNLLTPEEALKAYLDLSFHKIPPPLRLAHKFSRAKRK